jgi:hypothetical protein
VVEEHEPPEGGGVVLTERRDMGEDVPESGSEHTPLVLVLVHALDLLLTAIVAPPDDVVFETDEQTDEDVDEDGLDSKRVSCCGIVFEPP